MALNNCLSQGYNKEISENNLECKIKVHDIQSKETNDLVFEFSLPKLDSEIKNGERTEELTKKAMSQWGECKRHS